jgi:hypothetical protein
MQGERQSGTYHVAASVRDAQRVSERLACMTIGRFLSAARPGNGLCAFSPREPPLPSPLEACWNNVGIFGAIAATHDSADSQ